MADDKTKRGPQDAARINVNEPHELRYWCEALNCSEQELREAVKNVGVMADDVRAHMGRS